MSAARGRFDNRRMDSNEMRELGVVTIAAAAIVCAQLFSENIRTLFNVSAGAAPAREWGDMRGLTPDQHLSGPKTMGNFGQNNTSQY